MNDEKSGLAGPAGQVEAAPIDTTNLHPRVATVAIPELVPDPITGKVKISADMLARLKSSATNYYADKQTLIDICDISPEQQQAQIDKMLKQIEDQYEVA